MILTMLQTAVAVLLSTTPTTMATPCESSSSSCGNDNDSIPPAPPVVSCSVGQDDIRLFGSGGDAGRVELCHPDDSTWRYVCASQNWDLTTATVACRQLGYRSAFMANTAVAMAFTGDSGAVTTAGIRIASCQGDEASLRDCQLDYRMDAATEPCTLHEAVGTACSTAMNNTAQATYPIAVETHVQTYLKNMESWWTRETERQGARSFHQRNPTCLLSPPASEPPLEEDCASDATFDKTDGEYSIPNPFRDIEAIKEAFLFPDSVLQTYQQIETDYFDRSLTELLLLQQQHQQQPAEESVDTATSVTTTITMKDLQESLRHVRWNALGMDFSDFFPPPMTLEQVEAKLRQEQRLFQTIRDLYLGANQHNSLHWYLDLPYRYYSQLSASSSSDDDRKDSDQEPPITADPTVQEMFETLQRDGILLIDDFGADIDAIVQQAEASLTGDALYRKNETSITGGGSILTSRKPMTAALQVLVHNSTLAAVIEAYLGRPALLHGYKVTRIARSLTTTDQYNAGMYHHDRVGRRLKLFLFLHDVDCMVGHPTKVAAGSHRMLYYKTEDYPVTRFTDDFVEQHYTILKGCGKRGGGFLFDTHTIHKGTVQGEHERTVLIAEYHHVAKCAYSKEHNLGIPCPAGDIYRTDQPLTA